jgi:hypothetical protein
MSCKFDKDIIQRYADNTIDPLELIFLKEHINSCDECKKDIDLAMKLENSLDKFFSEDPGVSDLGLMITQLVDDCMYELSRREKLKYTLNKGMKMGSSIIDNSVRFIKYFPGSKRMNNSVKKSAAGAGGFLKNLMKKEAERLIESFR